MLKVQNYLKTHLLSELKKEFGIAHKILNGKVSLNYDQIESPMGERICQECRGLILRENTWDIVAYPFDKFFNMQESYAAKVDWKSAKFLEKLDGSLIVLYYDAVLDKWYTATRKMPEGDGTCPIGLSYGELAKLSFKKMGISFEELTSRLNKRYTYMFEMTTPHNRVLVDYQSLTMTLLGVRDIDSLKELEAEPIAKSLGLPSPTTFSFNNIDHMIEVVNDWNPLEHEGVVVLDDKFNRIKVKNIAYIASQALVHSIHSSDRNLMTILLLKKDDDIMSMVDDIMKAKIILYKKKLRKLIKEVESDWEELKDIETDKDFAAAAKQKIHPHALFFMRRKGVGLTVSDFFNNQAESKQSIDKVISLCGIERFNMEDIL